MRISAYLTAALLTISVAAVAQVKVCIGGDLDSLSPAQINACQAKSETLRHEAQVRGTQGDWHFVVVCDEIGWNEYASFTSDPAAVLQTDEQTDSQSRATFVRGSKLKTNDARRLDLLLTAVDIALPLHTPNDAVAPKSPVPLARRSVTTLMARR